jgi:hypothetical protein
VPIPSAEQAPAFRPSGWTDHRFGMGHCWRSSAVSLRRKRTTAQALDPRDQSDLSDQSGEEGRFGRFGLDCRQRDQVDTHARGKQRFKELGRLLSR